MNTIIRFLLSLTFCVTLCSSCKDFIFEKIPRAADKHPADNPKVPKTGADLFVPPVIQSDIPNPDAEGAFADWATCLVMFKEGHSHGNGKLHGNFVYDKAPWKQEQFAVVSNTSEGIRIKMDEASLLTHIEKVAGKPAPRHYRLIGGTKLWALCFYFFDKRGDLINDKILERSDQYQIFFSVSDMDDLGNPYEIMDLRYRGEGQSSPSPSEYFANKRSFEDRRQETRKVFSYTYRDTWRHEDMSDGVRDLFNLRLLPPLTNKDMHTASAPEDQDFVGLKGHFKFDYFDDAVDWSDSWPLKLRDGRVFRRSTYLLPQFYLAVRVMKCAKGRKALSRPAEGRFPLSDRICAPFDAPNPESGWQELIRMNLPIRVYTNNRDTEPAAPDPNEPYFFHIGREIGLSAQEAYEAANNVNVHGGVGFGSWFL